LNQCAFVERRYFLIMSVTYTLKIHRDPGPDLVKIVRCEPKEVVSRTRTELHTTDATEVEAHLGRQRLFTIVRDEAIAFGFLRPA
jgi:hypothetical protein